MRKPETRSEGQQQHGAVGRPAQDGFAGPDVNLLASASQCAGWVDDTHTHHASTVVCVARHVHKHAYCIFKGHTQNFRTVESKLVLHWLGGPVA